MADSSKCFMAKAPKNPPPLVQNGKVVLQAHHVGWIVSGLFAAAATIVSFWLVNKHLQWYTNKHEQRYIIRILFMVPLYAIISFASYLFWNQSTPLLLLRDCYEATVLTAFFYLLLLYTSPDPDGQRAIYRKVGLSKENDQEARMRGEPPKKWVLPLGFLRSKPKDGLYFLQIMKWGVLQYCVIRPLTTLVAVILNYAGLYCESSWSPGWGYAYITVIVSISVSISMYCLVQAYVPIATLIAPHKPILKLFAIKAVVFLTFWQATFLSLLVTFGVVKDTEYMTAEDINIGISAILETVEMTIFAFLHIKAFSYKEYKPPMFARDGTPLTPPQRTPRLRSLGHAFDFRETFREIWHGYLYIFDRMRGRETDQGARRLAVREDLFGPRQTYREKPPSDKGSITVNIEKQVHVGNERQWIGAGDDYAYGLDYPRKERSAGLEEQIDDELEKRGMPRTEAWVEKQRLYAESDGFDDYNHRLRDSGERDRILELRRGISRTRRRSWWREVYDQISRSSRDGGRDSEPASSRPPSRKLSRKSTSRHRQSGSMGSPYAALPEIDTYSDRPISSSVAYETFRQSGFSSVGPNEIRGSDSRSGRSGRSRDLIDSPSLGSDASMPRQAHRGSRSDKVLSRIFPSSPATGSVSIEGSSSASVGRSNPPSSQSHARQIALAPPGVVVPQSHAPERKPILMYSAAARSQEAHELVDALRNGSAEYLRPPPPGAALPRMTGPPLITYPGYPGAPPVVMHSGGQYPSFMMPFVFNHPSEAAQYHGVAHNTDKHLPPTPQFPAPPGNPSYVPFPSADSAGSSGPSRPTQSRGAAMLSTVHGMFTRATNQVRPSLDTPQRSMSVRQYSNPPQRASIDSIDSASIYSDGIINDNGGLVRRPARRGTAPLNVPGKIPRPDRAQAPPVLPPGLGPSRSTLSLPDQFFEATSSAPPQQSVPAPPTRSRSLQYGTGPPPRRQGSRGGQRPNYPRYTGASYEPMREGNMVTAASNERVLESVREEGQSTLDRESRESMLARLAEMQSNHSTEKAHSHRGSSPKSLDENASLATIKENPARASTSSTLPKFSPDQQAALQFMMDTDETNDVTTSND